MTELTIRPEEIRDAIERNVAAYSPATAREEVGRVIETGDGIARVEGLHSAMTNELLEFEGGLLGLALNLDVREIGVVLLGDGSKVEEGQAVRRTGEVLSVPIGDAFMGRVVDPLGAPIDGLGPIAAEGRRALEVQAPTVVQRQPVKEPLLTGIKAIDGKMPRAANSSNMKAITNGLPNIALMAAAPPSSMPICTSCGARPRIKSAPIVVPMMMSGASGPSTNPKIKVPRAASRIDGALMAGVSK